MRLESYLNERNVFPPEPGEAENLMNMLKLDCKPFLKEYKKSVLSNRFLWRGSDKSSGLIQKVRSRLDSRIPKDMPKNLHERLNDEFKKKFGWYVRNGVFTIRSQDSASHYGRPYLFLPIGKYKYAWSKNITDLYLEFNEQNMLEFNEDYVYDLWLSEYSEGSEGHLEYDGEEVYSDDPNDIIDELGLDKEDYDEGLLKWIPDIDEDTYIKQEEENFNNKQNDLIKDVVRSYTDKNLDRAIQSKHEISFNCREYYLVNNSLLPQFIEMMKEI